MGADASVVATRANAVPWTRRFIGIAVGVCIGAVLGLSLCVGLVWSGVVRNPFGPVVRGDVELARSDRPGLRVLFVGNSFTFRNEMPELVHKLADADGGRARIFAVSYTAGGWTLRKASRDDGLTGLLRDVRWDVVVLQEQSRLPSLSAMRRREETYPYARALDAKIVRVGARTMLFMTWGYAAGDDPGVPGDSFGAMQSRLQDGYSELATELSASVSVAPVGVAWAEAVRRHPEVGLWAGDGQHPSRLGSYLTACVFYAVLGGSDPIGNPFTAGLDPSEARSLQNVASDVAFNGREVESKKPPDYR